MQKLLLGYYYSENRATSQIQKPKVLPNMVFPPIWGKNGRRSEHAHASYPGLILVPRGRAPFGQHQESRPLAMSNTGSPRLTDFPSLCARSESSLTNLIGSGLNLLCLQSHSKTKCRWTGPEVAILGADQKGAQASGNENVLDSLFARLGSAPIGGGKKREFRDWTRVVTAAKQTMNLKIASKQKTVSQISSG